MYCKQCGIEITDSTLKKCPKCNTTIGKGGRFCEFCGKPKKSSQTQCECQSLKNKPIETEKAKMQEPNTGVKKQSGKESPSTCVANRYQQHFLANQDTIVEPETDTEQKVEDVVHTSNPLYAKIAAQKEKKHIVDIVGEQMIGDLIGGQENEVCDGESQNKRIMDSKRDDDKKNPIPILKSKAEKVSASHPEVVSAHVSSPEPTPSNFESKPVQEKENSETPASNDGVDQFYPDAFNQANFTVPKPELPKIKKDKKEREPTRKSQVSTAISNHLSDLKDKKQNGEKKNLDFFWVASLTCFMLAISQIRPIAMYSLLGVSTVFAVIDIIVSKKKYGIGMFAGLAAEIILCLI